MSERPDVHVLSCGGTIASEPGADGATPTKAGADLVDAVPELTDHASIRTRDVASRPGFDMDLGVVADLAAAVAAAADAGADGVVVTHGTDTLADTAYVLSLTTSLPVPVVVTGSQRRFDEPSTDAPANLLTATRAATDDRFAPGIHVAFDDELHAARDAVKAHTNALDAFRSPGKGPVASFTRGGVAVHRPPRESPVAVDLDAAAAAETTVPVVHSGTGVTAEALRRVAADADGVVVEGTGLGNVTSGLGDAVADVVDDLPVVVASRCHAGPTEPVYGTPGGAVTLREHGVLFAGDLSTAKARLTLLLALAAGRDREGIAAAVGAASAAERA
jgi:L-asparaginase